MGIPRPRRRHLRHLAVRIRVPPQSTDCGGFCIRPKRRHFSWKENPHARTTHRNINRVVLARVTLAQHASYASHAPANVIHVILVIVVVPVVVEVVNVDVNQIISGRKLKEMEK